MLNNPNLALLVNGHVHPDEALVREQVRALGPKAERRVDLAKQGQQVGVVHQAPRVRDIKIDRSIYIYI